MMKRYKISNLIFAGLIFSGAINLSACSLNSVIDELKDPDELYEELHQKPRFWYDSVVYDEKKGLYTLTNEYFKRKPYNNLSSFGDNVLLVGQGAYMDDSEYQYSFDLYDPWKNSIVASISHEDTQCDFYQVVGDQLFLINSESASIDVYDQNLSFRKHLNLDSYGILTDYQFFPTDSDDSFLAYNYVEQKLYQIDMASSNASDFDFGLYNAKLEAVSDDGNELLVTGVDKDTLQYNVKTLDTKSLVPTNLIRGTAYFPSDVSEEGFITAVDHVWSYHDNATATNISFNAENIRKADILPDKSVILNSDSAWEEDPDGFHTASYCHMSSSGELLSSFTFECGEASQPGYVYFGEDYAYLPDANCVMFLNYTMDVNPYILIWDLNVLTGDNALDIEFLEDGKLSNEASDDNKDSEAVDFGALTEANDLATNLEDKYDIDIYIGEEVPTPIDVFNTKTSTDPDIVVDSLNTLSEILSCYPDNFFSQLCYGDLKKIEVYLSGEITSYSSETIGAAGGLVTVQDDKIIMVLDTNEKEYWDYTVHHEISHMIDRRLDFRILYENNSIYSDEKWNSYNPEDFEYLNSYSDYSGNEKYTSSTDYFIDDYGVTFPTEDRAEIFGKAMEEYMNENMDTAFFLDNSPIKQKLAYYSKAIREGFNTSEWPNTMPWETMLKK